MAASDLRFDISVMNVVVGLDLIQASVLKSLLGGEIIWLGIYVTDMLQNKTRVWVQKEKQREKLQGCCDGKHKARLLEMISLRMCYRWRKLFYCLISQGTQLLQARTTVSKIEMNLYVFSKICPDAELI